MKCAEATGQVGYQTALSERSAVRDVQRWVAHDKSVRSIVYSPRQQEGQTGNNGEQEYTAPQPLPFQSFVRMLARESADRKRRQKHCGGRKLSHAHPTQGRQR